MRNIAFKYGLMMLVGFVALFLIMHEVGQAQNYNLRVLNGAIHLGLLVAAIREYRAKFPESYANYVSGVAVGMWSSVVGALSFAIFLFFYLIADEAFMAYIQNAVPIGQYLNPFTTSLFIVVEGIAVGLIGSYIATRVIDMIYAPEGAWKKFRR